MRRTFTVGALIVGATAGCDAILGIDAGVLRDPPGAGGDGVGAEGGQAVGGAGGGGGMSSAGGSGAGGQGTAVDWADSFHALWRFDTLMLGVDSSPSGRTLTLMGVPGQLTGPTIPQGSSAANLNDASTGFHTVDEFFAVAGSITFGGWFRTSDVVTEPVAMGRYGDPGPTGYWLRRTADGEAECNISNVSAGYSAVSSEGAWPADGTWRHVVCRYDATQQRFDVVVDGTFESVQDQNQSLDTVIGIDLEIGFSSVDASFVGAIDEIFVQSDVVPDDALRRIYACGSDGARCECHGQTPGLYVTSGRLADGSLLPACNSPGF